MSTRRTFFLSTAVAASVPLVTATLGASRTAFAADSSSPVDADLKRQMNARLTTQLNDATTASTEVGYLQDIFFAWDLPTVAAAQITSIVAYSFGNRPGAPGAAPLAGPINELIADAVHQLYLLKPVPVYAQAEVASILASKYLMNSASLHSFSPPTVTSSGAITYPTLDTVATAISTSAGSATSLGTVAVVTHRDQAKRAIQTSIAHGMKAFAASEITLPVAYDALASQPSNRRRDLYLLNDMTNQFATLRLNLIAQEYPNG
jgi:hypothetical protein